MRTGETGEEAAGAQRVRVRRDARRAAGLRGGLWPDNRPGPRWQEIGARDLVRHTPHLASPGALAAAGLLTPAQAADCSQGIMFFPR